ncbi:hypothetical protein DPX16_23766 [Anabarilius grahami]|uniref:Uncharacterized protein n=1 Tax=Anabarilius grahami TaxID=495550 RepID=A0A3N0Z8Z0_ANAGA|nr:hypothetical protein DPX16_23766 [Anabarilius grahami]
MPHRGGRVAIFTAAQETLIVDMVRENNLIRLREIRDKVIADNVNFESIDDVSLATIDRVLRHQKMRMKQVYRVPFERNSARHKDLRYEYVQKESRIHLKWHEENSITLRIQQDGNLYHSSNHCGGTGGSLGELNHPEATGQRGGWFGTIILDPGGRAGWY